MPQRYTAWLIPILILIALAAYVVWPNNPGIHFNLGSTSVDRDFTVHEGLDLQGGLQVLMEADLPSGATIDNRSMNVAKQIVEQRVNALGVTEPVVQRQGERRIVIELPGITDPQQAIETIKQTGLLEFVDLGTQPLTADTAVRFAKRRGYSNDDRHGRKCADASAFLRARADCFAAGQVSASIFLRVYRCRR